MKINKVTFIPVTLLCIGLTGLQAQNTVKDADGNIYKTIKIGNQVWMAENLKTTQYNDGSSIPYLADSINLSDPKFDTIPICYVYNNDIANKSIYGALYNWSVVNTCKLCPINWHVPDSAEMARLISTHGGQDSAGVKLKETGTKHWSDPNEEVTNETGFTALPGGLRGLYGGFGDIGIRGSWWSSTKDKNIKGFAWAMDMYCNQTGVFLRNEDNWINMGYSVRCLKD